MSNLFSAYVSKGVETTTNDDLFVRWVSIPTIGFATIWEHIWILFQRHHGPSKSILNDILQFGQWLWRNSTPPHALLISLVVVNIFLHLQLPAFWKNHKSIQILFQVVASNIICFSFTPILGEIYPTWRAYFFQWVETTNPLNKAYISHNQPSLRRAAFINL